MERSELVNRAIEAREKSYSPYSGFCVGAALETEEGEVYLGCNIENAAFGPSVCAERTAIFKAVSEGRGDFKQIAIVGAPRGEEIKQFCSPCGVCRQVMSEFCRKDTFQIHLFNGEEIRSFYLEELLPHAFDMDGV